MDSAENAEEYWAQRNVIYLTLTRVPKVSMRLMKASENKVTKTQRLKPNDTEIARQKYT